MEDSIFKHSLYSSEPEYFFFVATVLAETFEANPDASGYIIPMSRLDSNKYKEATAVLREMDNVFKTIVLVSPVYDPEKDGAEFEGMGVDDIAELLGLGREPTQQEADFINDSYLSYSVVKNDEFDNFYKHLKRRHLQAELDNLDNKSNPSEKTNTSSDGIAKISFSNKIIRLSYNGTTLTIKKFRTVQGDNHRAFEKLFTFPGAPHTQVDMKLRRRGTVVKDLPKTMGFNNLLKDLFFEFSSKEQTIMFHKSVAINDKQFEIIRQLIKS